MALKLKNHLTNNATLKVASCILGYALWAILSQSHNKTIEVQVPVCFYGHSQYEYKAPEKINITLVGKRTDLRCLDQQALAVHVNAQELKIGTHKLPIDATTLFLPDTIKLVNYLPANCAVEVLEPIMQDVHQNSPAHLVAMNEEVEPIIEIVQNNAAPTVQA